MAGRKRKPDHLKLVGGTAQKCRMNPDAPVANVGLASAPEWLSAAGAEIYDRVGAIIFGMGIASPDDVDALAMLASRLEEIQILTGLIEDQGRTYRIKNGPWKARPEVAMRNEALRHAQSLLAEFGLTPAARSKVSAGKAPASNPFADLD
ncbi:phage terminase small subunit P27 family [Falsirhodobacter halotolerans]|uniref:phage terminase small subunit P27 family n=1 Tax=Falsirhodobacter halotolerans TaxID=1146892 RepID=UPI001FD24E9D|nr:phage terminase small subunit P27 family [Falsirhodobacter halotolerans]MCJ8139575.1 phage terminase small subunit P27 family [Falsirhodobacter halotolerans]